MTERGARAAEIVQILTAARATISNPENWIKEAFWGRDYGAPIASSFTDVVSDYEGATRFCALGAIRRNNPRGIGSAHLEAEQALALASPNAGFSHEESVYEFNDMEHTTHADILAMFDLAIENQCRIVREEAEKDDPNISSEE